MRTHLAALLSAMALACSAFASTGENDIAFAIPQEGLVTLGIFDSAGRLIRTLHSLEPEEDFRKGLNGLITFWDGLDTSGKALPPGQYHIRGYLIPEVAVEGVAYHFNDWLAGANAPALAWIEDFDILAGDTLLIAAQTPEGSLFCTRMEADGTFVWTTPLNGGAPALIATPGRTVFVKTDTTWHSLSTADGTPTANSLPATLPASVSAISATGDTLLIATGSGISSFPENLPTPPPQPPVAFSALAAAGSTLIGAGHSGLWISTSGTPFRNLTLPVHASSLSTRDETAFWFTGTAMDPDSTPLVGQVDTDGELLRMLSTSADAPPPIKIRALPDRGGFMVLDQSTSVQAIRLITKTGDGNWTIVWERRIEKAPSFGFVNGAVVPNAGDKPANNSLPFRLSENPLTGERGDIFLKAASGPSGTFLVTGDGLPVARISERIDTTQFALERGPDSGSIRLLQGNAAGAEEFLVRNLGSIIPLNVGRIELEHPTR